MATANNLIGKVTVLAGHATARGVDGEVRELKLGDPVFEGAGESLWVLLEIELGKEAEGSERKCEDRWYNSLKEPR